LKATNYKYLTSLKVVSHYSITYGPVHHCK